MLHRVRQVREASLLPSAAELALARSRAHSELGAELLTAAGASPRVAELTRLHHRPAGRDAMLALLQRADAAT